jgi:four helix bundle protein
MSELRYAASFRELIVYQKARKLAREIFELTSRFPKDETFSLVDQVRRSSRSIGAQVAEAWAKRNYEKHFTSKLTDADGEQQETQHWIETALDCHYLTRQEAESLLQQCAEIGRLLGGMLAKADRFCKPTSAQIREIQAEYLTSSKSDY